MRASLLLISLSCIHAFPLGGVDSKAKRCEVNDCPLPPPLPYIPGYNAATCPKGHPSDLLLIPEGKKRSIIPTDVITHTETNDSSSLLQSRSNTGTPVCTEIYAHNVVAFDSRVGMTHEIYIHFDTTYFLSYTFDVPVQAIYVWQHLNDRSIRVQGISSRRHSGSFVLRPLPFAIIHFQFVFAFGFSNTFRGYGNFVNINGRISVYRID